MEMYECEWKRMRERDPEIKAFVQSRRSVPKTTLTEDEVINAVRDGSMFGLIEVDIQVPDNLKEYFEKMTPIFKNIDLTREDIGEFMSAYAKEHNIMKVSYDLK